MSDSALPVRAKTPPPTAPPTPERSTTPQDAAAPADAPRERPKLTAEDFFPEAHLPPRGLVAAELPFSDTMTEFKFLHRIVVTTRKATLYLLLRVLLAFAELAADFSVENARTPTDAPPAAAQGGIERLSPRELRAKLVAELSPPLALARLVICVRRNLPSRDTLARAGGADDIALLVTPLLTQLSRVPFAPVTALFFDALNRRPDMRVSGAIFFSTEELDADRELRARTARAWNAFVAPGDWALVPVAPGTTNKRAKWVPRGDAPDAF